MNPIIFAVLLAATLIMVIREGLKLTWLHACMMRGRSITLRPTYWLHLIATIALIVATVTYVVTA